MGRHALCRFALCSNDFAYQRNFVVVLNFGFVDNVSYFLLGVTSRPLMSSCQKGICTHPRAYKWIQCDRCGCWLHFSCANIPVAKTSMKNYLL